MLQPAEPHQPGLSCLFFSLLTIIFFFFSNSVIISQNSTEPPPQSNSGTFLPLPKEMLPAGSYSPYSWPPTSPSKSTFSFFLKIFYLLIFRGKKGTETSMCDRNTDWLLLLTPNWEPGPQPRYVP